MLFRFCSYGFLKNQRYFEPFLWLALVDKGLSVFEIGVLMAIESATVIALEVPSGAVADLFGRRRTLVLSFAAYLLSFFVFAIAGSFWALCGAMVLFGIGESFRSGTHKALIFAWLELEGRSGEKTKVYGLTRSFSKYGSAVSALIAAAMVYATASYGAVFSWSMLPCALSIVNLLGYPADIDPPRQRRASVGEVFTLLRDTARDAVAAAPLRRLLAESMAFHGLFRASKDFLQLALVTAAVVWIGHDAGELQDESRSALLVGPVYFLLFVVAGLASRNAHRVSGWAGGDARAATWLWGCLALLFAVLTASSALGLSAVVITGFVFLHVLQNLWRPVMTSRIYEEIEERKGTTVLSIDSLGQRLTTMVLAPCFGALFDRAESFWPVALVGAVVAAGFLLLRRRVSSSS